MTREGEDRIYRFYDNLPSMSVLRSVLNTQERIRSLQEMLTEEDAPCIPENGHLLLFSCCNDNTLRIARSAPRDVSGILFACEHDALPASLAESVKAADALCIAASVENLFDVLLESDAVIEVFLFDASEESNLRHLSLLCRILETHPGAEVQIHVELERAPYGLYDDLSARFGLTPGGKPVIHPVRTAERYAEDLFLSESIFENTRDDAENGCRQIRFLIVGMNARSLAVLKTLLPLAQMPGYRLRVLVLDPAPGGWDRLCRLIPEIDRAGGEGDALYELHYFDPVDLSTDAPRETLCRYLADPTHAYIDTGDDLTDFELALRLRTLCARFGDAASCRILVRTEADEFARDMSSQLTEHLTFVGARAHVYDYSILSAPPLASAAAAIWHLQHPENGSEHIADEYCFHAMCERILSYRYKQRIIDADHGGDHTLTSTDRTWLLYEHMRWNVFTRMMGYRCAGDFISGSSLSNERDRRIAMLHGSLVEYDALSPEEQEKDAFVLNDEILRILKNL
ncbi:MAG: hypothetical protein IKO80_04980 [Lachnospiraceae bacterium]|nr:hypothetical protein [Lachnospiraceae bacterium]